MLPHIRPKLPHLLPERSRKIGFNKVSDTTSEAQVNDPSIDFTGHLAAFDQASLQRLVAAYERAGGRTWPAMVEHVIERFAVVSPIRYGIFAIITGNEQHVAGAKSQLGV